VTLYHRGGRQTVTRTGVSGPAEFAGEGIDTIRYRIVSRKGR
jgi:hypothetical protein